MNREKECVAFLLGLQLTFPGAHACEAEGLADFRVLAENIPLSSDPQIVQDHRKAWGLHACIL